LFENNFDKEFVKTFLIQKRGFFNWNGNFLLNFPIYSNPENSRDLLKLFDLIFSICGADSELFNDLFYAKARYDDQTYFEKLKRKCKNEILKLVIDWIVENLGLDFLMGVLIW
jgi:hypothetical protein